MVYLILAHKNPKQLYRLISILTYQNTKFVIHIDADSDIEKFKCLFQKRSQDVFFLADRKVTKWGSFQIIEATIVGLQYIEDILPDTDRVTLLSGQDYPIKTNKYIHQYFDANKEKIYMEFFSIPCEKWVSGGRNRFPDFEFMSQMIDIYAGSQWWSFPMKIVKRILIDLKGYPNFTKYFKWVTVPDESFFQTLLINYYDPDINDNIVNESLRMISWHPPYTHPKTIFSREIMKITKSKKLFARKFDAEVDSTILDKIDNHILNFNENRTFKKKNKALRKSLTQVILVLTNKIQILKSFYELKEQLPNENIFLLYHENNDNKIENDHHEKYIFKFNDSILHGLGFKPIEKSLLPGSNHFPLFSFYNSYPDFDYYWVIEDDVYYNGHWNNFFNNFSPNSIRSDFISAHFKSFEQDPYWFWWNSLKKNGDSENLPAKLSSFNPIYRISKEAIIYLDQKMKDGWIGHHEILIPTLLYNAGFSLLDFGGDGPFCFAKNINKFYKNSFCTIKDQAHHSSLRYRPLVLNDEITDNIIYHPVKNYLQ